MTDANPTIELFAIGTELAIGQIQDTNSHWLSQQIARLGGQPRRMTILTDDMENIILALQDSLDRNTDILLVNGGLGPTPDDMTVEAIARLVDRPIVRHEPTIEDFMERRNYRSVDEVSPGLMKMATVPEGAEAFPNPAGWAPCIRVEQNGTTIFVMAGPPREMKAVFTHYISDFLSERFKTRTATRRVWSEMYESEVSPHLQAVMDEFPGTYLKAYVALRSEEKNAMPIDIVAIGANDDDAQQKLEEATERLSERVREAGKHFELDD